MLQLQVYWHRCLWRKFGVLVLFLLQSCYT